LVGIYIAGAVAALALAAGALARRGRGAGTEARVDSTPRTIGGDPIDAFWSWWQSVRGPLAKAIDDRTLDAWVDPLTERVRAIDPGLAWELGPGVRSQHHLCVTGEGSAPLRVTAERWLSRAPAPDAVWEYYPARQPSRRDRKLTLQLDGVDLSYDDFRVGLELDETRRLVHIAMYHPKFGDLPEGERTMALFLTLDDWLGEDGVERWVGRARCTLEASDAPSARDALTEAVDKLASLNPGDFTLLEGKHQDGRRRLAVVNFGLKRLDHLLMDVHFEVTIRYPDRGDGLYSEPVGEDVNAMEDALLEQLGREAVYIGHETGLGQRVIHLHATGTGQARDILTRWERMHPTWEIGVVARSDPQWDVLKRW
jgi:hypothetical protein